MLIADFGFAQRVVRARSKANLSKTTPADLQGDLTSVQAVEAIVSAKQKERLKEVERKKLEIAAEHDRQLQQAAEEHQALHEDNQLRKASARIEQGAIEQQRWTVALVFQFDMKKQALLHRGTSWFTVVENYPRACLAILGPKLLRLALCNTHDANVSFFGLPLSALRARKQKEFRFDKLFCSFSCCGLVHGIVACHPAALSTYDHLHHRGTSSTS